MTLLKKLSFLLAGLFSVCVLASCNSTNFKTAGFKNVDFSKEQKIHVVTKDFAYNILVSYNSYGSFTMRFIDEAPETLKDVSVEFVNDACTIKTEYLEHTVSVDMLTMEFFPLVLYKFFSVTDFNSVQWEFNEAENICFFETSVSGKVVVFSASKALEAKEQIYMIEIK